MPETSRCEPPTPAKRSHQSRGIRKQPTLTAEQITRFLPFQKKMLRRYQQVADHGYSDLPDPLCAKVKNEKGETCCDCPCFGFPLPPPKRCINKKTGKPYMRDSEFIHCSRYYPQAPQCITDGTQEVALSLKPKPAQKKGEAAGDYRERVRQWNAQCEATRERAKAWGRQMVAWIEAVGQ